MNFSPAGVKAYNFLEFNQNIKPEKIILFEGRKSKEIYTFNFKDLINNILILKKNIKCVNGYFEFNSYENVSKIEKKDKCLILFIAKDYVKENKITKIILEMGDDNFAII